MPDILIQFYATPTELLTFASDIVKEFNLYIVAMRYPPINAVEIKYEELEKAFFVYPPCREFMFLLCQPKLPVEGRMEFIRENPNCLSLQIGRLTESFLGESCLTTRTNDAEVFAIWRKIANRFKKQTKAGITAIDRQSGVSAYYKSGRYTQGAYILQTSGIEMIPVQGKEGPKIVLGEKAE